MDRTRPLPAFSACAVDKFGLFDLTLANDFDNMEWPCPYNTDPADWRWYVPEKIRENWRELHPDAWLAVFWMAKDAVERYIRRNDT